MLQELWSYIKNPNYTEDANQDFSYRFRTLVVLTALSIMASIVLGLTIAAFQGLFQLDLGKHAIDDLVENYPPVYLFLGAVVLAPVLEELLFRGPMIFFKRKSYFPIIYYALTLIFGFYHITNFEITTTIILMSPLLVSPQLFVGSALGFIRVRFGLLWAIGLHALYNLLLVGPILLLKVLNIPLE
ncbi:CPBP family intramembrane metalloprotease [Maribacter sp. MJ134]|uniref:CPBP family intramembrane glutamic endopeptidase n=1 Tax=Maribacter sp. MJ134 TaxID=2496865 RepID=UPI000F84BFF1|nr:CPBP family intramembrane glutamic endopeptidase [Maribacter sp. MJ134]AZQ58243.1 CPBP family intramembrane metalloprotease [Maribacter sp. MJ134]